MSDLILREDALRDVVDALKTYYINGKPLINDISEDVIYSAICSVPPANIVRCMYCKHYEKDHNSFHGRCLNFGASKNEVILYVYDGFFCSNGDRRDDDE